MSQYSQGSARYFSAAKHPHHHCSHPSLLFNGEQSFFLKAKQLECAVSHSPPSSAEIKNE